MPVFRLLLRLKTFHLNTIFICQPDAGAYTLTDTAIPGLIYFALGPLHALNGWWFGRQVRALGRVTAG